MFKCAQCGPDEEAEYICEGYSLCYACYQAWCEIPEDLHPYVIPILEILRDVEENIALGNREDFEDDIEAIHYAINEFRGRMYQEGRAT